MSNKITLESEIVDLRKKGLSYRDIEKELGCSKGSISYHCKKNDIVDTGMKNYPIPEEIKVQISDFCKKNTSVKASQHFKLSVTTIKKFRKYNEKAR